MINGISLFANVGIDETYFKENGVNIVASNELISKRCDFYSHLYPEVEMICGDISNSSIFNKMVELYQNNNCKFLISTPPCQGMSQAGKMDENDERNLLIIYTIEFIKKTLPENIIIENVPQILNFSIKINNKIVKIIEYIKKELKPLGYFINYRVLDACDYETPQNRKRAVFLISKISKWKFPKKSKIITVKEAIGDLPSLESDEKSIIPNHFAKKHNNRHITWMKHTPTGKTAFDNEIHYPQKDGRKIKGYRTTYKRISWDKPAPTITMCNGSVSSQNNVHPGRKLDDGTYSDARVLTILELLRLTGLPDDWNIPEWASENFIRQVIGESFPPKFATKLLETMPKEVNQ
ncbi:MAG: DNA cytosine methyltransferase [Methanobrevibacter sp.]|jgi:DNA (cytosine-5)-methyltransferase 1|nr:DNA cytosine methyltransferase [Candidatus Methanoflexus mossambicus]